MKVFAAVSVWALMLLALLSPAALAQDATGWARLDSAPPEPPEGFVSEMRGAIRWVYPPNATDEVEELSEQATSVWLELEDDLGVDVPDALEVRVARGPEEMRELAPTLRPPPNYASGVAYTDLGLIILTLTAPETWETPNLEDVFAHELSHIALRRAVQGRPLPRWFVEGLAIHQSGERSVARFQTLYNGALSHSLIPLERLSGAFSERSHEVSLAYAQSGDIVEYLRSADDRHPQRFRSLIYELSQGETFEDALLEAYSVTPFALETEWKSAVEEQMSSIPTLVGGSTFWVLASLLVLWAFRKRRRAAKATLDRWESEEQEAHEAFARAEAAIDAQLAASDDVLVITQPGPPQDPGVPTVEIDGQNHTLH